MELVFAKATAADLVGHPDFVAAVKLALADQAKASEILGLDEIRSAAGSTFANALDMEAISKLPGFKPVEQPKPLTEDEVLAGLTPDRVFANAAMKTAFEKAVAEKIETEKAAYANALKIALDVIPRTAINTKPVEQGEQSPGWKTAAMEYHVAQGRTLPGKA
jgi:hypothetical protein